MPRSDLERLLNARHKKSFSPAEKIALRGQLEWKGYPSDAINAFLESGEDDRELWYKEYAPLSPRTGGNTINQDQKEVEMSSRTIQNTPISPNHQISNSLTSDPFANSTFATPTTENKTEEKKVEPQENNTKIPEEKPTQPNFTTQEIPNPEVGEQFSISNIVLWQSYSGYIKLQFNYGLFVTVKGVEWLLHKNEIVCPEWVSRKKYFTIGDPITVIAKELKDVEGEKRIVWSMK